MRPRNFDIPATINALRTRWRLLTHGTSRVAAALLCLLTISAAVVASSQAMPFTTARDSATANVSTEAERDAEESTGQIAIRSLTSTDYNESWRQAGDGWDRLGDIDRRHQILITPAGQLTGRIMTFADWRGDLVPLSNAAVHLMREGRVAAETSTDTDGQFVADGLTDGTYSLIAESEAGLLAYALHLRTAATDEHANEYSLESVASTQWDADAVIARVTNYWQSEPPIERTREPLADTIPKSVRPIPQGGAAATTLSSHQVRLQSDGRLIGRLRRLHPDTGRPIIAKDIEIALYRNGSLQGVAWTDETGYFEYAHMAPGVYSLVATGADAADPTSRIHAETDRGLHHGFLTFGLQVLPSEESTIIPVAADNTPVLEIDAALIDIADLQPFLGRPGETNLNTSHVDGQLTGNGGSTGGSGGATNGGAGGAGGDLGTFIAAGLAVGAAALLLDDDDSVVSPVRP